MAVHQYSIEFIPRKFLLDRYGTIPVLIEDYEQIAEKNWWADKLSISQVSSKLNNKYLPVEWMLNANDSGGFKDGKENDIYFYLSSDGFINSIGVRFNTAYISAEFIMDIIKVAVDLDCFIIDKHYHVYKPSLEGLLTGIERYKSGF